MIRLILASFLLISAAWAADNDIWSELGGFYQPRTAASIGLSEDGHTHDLSTDVTGELPTANVENLSGTNTGNQTITLVGDLTGNGTATIDAQLRTGVVGDTELASTTVTPGSYTNADVTIDADGRVTAASNGSGGGTGEANTASNSGVGGVGLVLTKSGVDLPFKSINAGSGAISVANDAGNNEIDIDVVPGNIDHDSLSGYLAAEHRDWTLDQGANNIPFSNLAGVDASGTDNSTNVTVAAGLDYLSINGAGQILTLGLIDLATDVTGLLSDGNVAVSNVTQHQAALSVTESQISDLSHTTNTDASTKCTGLESLRGDNTCVTPGGGGGSGDVVGPASAVDNRIATFDLTTGKIIQDGGSTVADVLARSNHTGSQSATTITSGVFTDARIAASNVTQHQTLLSITESQISDLSHTTDTNTNSNTECAGLESLRGNGLCLEPIDTNTQLSTEQVQDDAGIMVSFGVETRIDVTYDDAGSALNFVVDDMNDHSVTDILDLDDDAATLAIASSSSISGTNTGDQNLADTVAEITDLDNDAATLTIAASASISGSNTGDQNLADTVSEITDLDNDAATLTIGASASVSGTNTGDQTDSESETFVIETATTADDLRIKADGAITLTGLDCIATGATTPSAQVMTVMECSSAGASCASSGLTVTVSALTTNVSDATASDAAIDDNDWWGLDTTSLTTAADYIHCTVTYDRG